MICMPDSLPLAELSDGILEMETVSMRSTSLTHPMQPLANAPVRIAVVLSLFFTVMGGATPRAGFPAEDVTGTWDITVEISGETAHPSILLRQDGERISGTYDGQMGKSSVEGSLKGTDIQFRVTLKFQDAVYTITYTGTVNEDAMKGTVRFGDAGTGNWSAKRRKNRLG
jgi:hypothetical protein